MEGSGLARWGIPARGRNLAANDSFSGEENRMSKSIGRSITLVMALLSTVLAVPMPAQTPSTSLVIEGGTLIDGNGGTPVRDAVIVITGDRIASVSRKGQLTYPPNAQVIKADGEFILPGLWDSHGYGTWFINDMYLNHGVTSIVDNGLGGELSLVHREAVNRGKIPGPRYVTSVGNFSTDSGYSTGYEPILFHDRVPKSPAEARELTKGFINAKADFIFFSDGKLSVDIIDAIVDEAKKASAPVVLETVGPTLTLDKGIELGVAQMTHSSGIAKAIAKDPSKWNNELDLYSEMDDAKAQALIRRLVGKKITLTPNFLNSAPGLPKEWPRMQREVREMFSDPDILTYFPEFTDIEHIRVTALGLLHGPAALPLEPAVAERRRQGYLNMMRFHKMYVEAGGTVTAAGNTNVTKAVGLVLHQELECFVEGGFTPMQAIQAATKWPAETFHMLDRSGTIEAGKLADLLIVKEDPLQDIHNTQKIDSVVFNGKVIDRTYHPWPSDPFMDIGNYSWGNPPVESLSRVVTLKNVAPPSGLGSPDSRTAGIPNPPVSPQPGIETISPTLVTEGDPTTTLVIKGFNFVRRMQVFFDGRSVPYRHVSPTELDVTLDASVLRTPGKFDIVIKNQGPVATPDWGNGTSNTAHLLVNFKY
jgi:imidazolonepropionase-like amidohydrolase